MKKSNYTSLFILLLLLNSFLTSAQNCQVTNSFMTGDYAFNQTTPIHPANGVYSFENQIVNISLGDSSEKREFSAVWLEGLGIGQNPTDVSFALDCSNGNDVVVDSGLNTFLGCGVGSITLGPAATTGTFDENDDGSFTLILAEYVDNGGCAVPTPLVTEFSLTKCQPNPDNITFTNPTATSVDLNWIDVADTANTSNTYTIEYGVEGFDLGTGTFFNGISGSGINISGLQTDVMYDFYILSACSGNINISGPFPYGNFTNSDFVLDANGVTCLCPNANFGDVGTLTINGEAKTFTKRSRAQLDTVIADDIQDPQIALTCTSGITDMTSLFSGFNASVDTTFNQNLEHWDVSNVTSMENMFVFQSSFNQPLNNWDVSNVTNMQQIFAAADAFNQPLDNWDVSNVTNMVGMLRSNSFNQSLNNWDVSNVTNMVNLFAGASAFNQPLNNWNVNNVTNMSGLFQNALTFNQDLSEWTFNQNVFLFTFISGSNLSISNYDLLLQSFDSQGLVDKNIFVIDFAYCDEPTRNNLVNNKNWTITGDFLGQCGATFNPSTTPFLTTWIVQQGDLDVEIFTTNAFDYDFNVDWGDGQSDQNVLTDITHTYPNAGTYTVSITGVFPYFKTCKTQSDCDNATKLSSIESWGNQEWRLMQRSFSGAENLVLNTTQPPDLSFVTSLRETFRDAENFNQNINNWDVSNITDMTSILRGALSFNQSLNNWDVSNVINMENMFLGAISFNQFIGNWDVSNVTDMSSMFGEFFGGDMVFNQNISNWDVSKVTDMGSMFTGASSFNQSLSNWDVSKVTNMASMFRDATSFNQSLNNWDVSNVTNINFMFDGASNFNQPLNNWDVSNITDMRFMFNEASNFNQPLSDWDVSNVTNMQSMFSDATDFNQPLSDWDVSNVTNMQSMFNGASNFNQDISTWCVEQIPTEPTDFAINSALQASFFPNWGATCTLSVFENSLDNFKVYPNPVQDQLFLSWTDTVTQDKIEVGIYDINGKNVINKSYNQKPTEINVSQLSSGVYFLKVISGEQSQVKRIIKK